MQSINAHAPPIPKAKVILDNVMTLNGLRLNIADPVITVRLPKEIRLHSPHPTKSDSIKTKSLTPVGMLTKITNNIVPGTIA